MSNEIPAGTVQITQVLPPRDTYSLRDHLLLGFGKREQLRRWLIANHVRVAPDGHELRFSREEYLAGMGRASRLLALAPRAKRPRTAPANTVAPTPMPPAAAPAKPAPDPLADYLPPGLRLRPSGTR